MSTAKIVVLAAVGLLVLSGSAFGLTVALRSERETRTTIDQRVRKIVIHADAGDVDVRAGLTPSVIVDRVDHWLFTRPKVRQSLRDGTLEIWTKCGGVAKGLRCASDLRIDAPPEVDLTVRTKSGDVDVRGLSGRVQVETDAGDIAAHRVDTVTMSARTDAGDISLDVFGQPARTVADSKGGDLEITVPFGAYRIDASSDSGNVRVRGLLRDDLAPRAIHAMTHAGDVTVRAR